MYPLFPFAKKRYSAIVEKTHVFHGKSNFLFELKTTEGPLATSPRIKYDIVSSSYFHTQNYLFFIFPET